MDKKNEIEVKTILKLHEAAEKLDFGVLTNLINENNFNKDHLSIPLKKLYEKDIEENKEVINFVKILIEKGCDIYEEFDGKNMLMHACYKGWFEIVKFICNYDEKILSIINKKNNNCLYYAVISNKVNIDLIDFLLKRNVKYNLKCNCKKDTCLNIAVKIGNMSVAMLLLQYGADPNILTEEKMTTLHYACSNLNSNMMNLLLINGADPNVLNNNGETSKDILQRIIDVCEDEKSKTLASEMLANLKRICYEQINYNKEIKNNILEFDMIKLRNELSKIRIEDELKIKRPSDFDLISNGRKKSSALIPLSYFVSKEDSSQREYDSKITINLNVESEFKCLEELKQLETKNNRLTENNTYLIKTNEELKNSLNKHQEVVSKFLFKEYKNEESH